MGNFPSSSSKPSCASSSSCGDAAPPRSQRRPSCGDRKGPCSRLRPREPRLLLRSRSRCARGGAKALPHARPGSARGRSPPCSQGLHAAACTSAGKCPQPRLGRFLRPHRAARAAARSHGRAEERAQAAAGAALLPAPPPRPPACPQAVPGGREETRGPGSEPPSHGQRRGASVSALRQPGLCADVHLRAGPAAQPRGQRVSPRCHLPAEAVLPHPASPPVPAGPGRFPGCRRAAEHGHHPAAASPALHPGVRCLPLRPDAGHGLSHHDCFLGEARAAAPGRSALQPPPHPSRHPHALPPAWGGKPNAAVPVPWGRAERGSPWCRCARPFVPKLCARPQSHWRLSALPGAGAHHGQHHSPPAPASSCWPRGYCLLDLLCSLIPDGCGLRVRSLRAIHGWRAWHVAALQGRVTAVSSLQERSGCLESAWQGLPYVLAWLLPALTLLGQLIARGTSLTDIAPKPIQPVVPSNRSNETYSLYCSSCLLLIRRSQDICYEYVGRKDVGLEGKIIFFLYLLLVLSCCTLLYRRVKLWCRRNASAPLLALEKDGFAGRSIRSVSRVSHYFQLVFLLCWAPAFLLTILSFTSVKPASVFGLYVATALTTSLQGFLHSLAYGWLRRNFRREAVGQRPSLQHHRGLQGFYDESLGAIA
ncbi:uncharacterized protein [Anser cygnoides]|uniref:uncharacterized protein n=1 Tax=Anser cygnoides TaxID=8845 RepID=UPI0034D3294F